MNTKPLFCGLIEEDLHREIDVTKLFGDDFFTELSVNEDLAFRYFEFLLWNNSPNCPHCYKNDVYRIKTRVKTDNDRHLWRCRDCHKQFNIRTHTFLEDSRISLKHWAYVLIEACYNAYGIDAMRIHKKTGVSYKSSLLMIKRLNNLDYSSLYRYRIN